MAPAFYSPFHRNLRSMMMARNYWITLAYLSACIGCGGIHPPPIDQAVTVKGQVAANNGKPITNVALNLQPLESGHLRTVDVKPDGTFTVETQPGKYAYYFTPKAGAKTVPPQVSKARQASMERVVVVAPGQNVDITLP